MRTVLLGLVLLGIAAGCGSPAAPAVAVAVAVVEPPIDPTTQPMFDNLDYASWKRVPVGTRVKRKSVASSETSRVSTTTVETFTLKEVTDQEVVIERQNVTERSDGSYRTTHPPEPRKYPRQFRIPAGMTAEDFAKPARMAKKVGEEAVTVQGKSYATIVYAWTDSTEAGKMHVRVWLSEEMPGRIVKQEMKVPALKNTTLEDVIEVKLAD